VSATTSALIRTSAASVFAAARSAKAPSFSADRDDLRPERQPHAHDPHRVEPIDPGLDVGLAHGLIEEHAESRFVDEGLLVPEEHGLAADLRAVAAGAERHGADRGRRGRGQRGLALLAHVGALAQLGLALSQAHGEGETGRHATLPAVGAREQLEDLDS
jgi:hypothetical protein